MPTPNFIKYSTTPDSSGIKVGNYTIGVFSGGTYGPTSTTNYWNGVTPPISGYTIYENKAANGPSIRVAADASVLIDYTRRLYSGSSVTTEYSALTYLNSLGTVACVNRDYEEIITSGLTLNLDAGFTPSYPKSGTTWTDISFSGNNGTLVNGPTFNSANGGAIVFDGTNDNCPITNQTFNISTGSSFTIEIAYKRNSSTPGPARGLYTMGTGGISNARIYFWFDDNANGRMAINYFTQSGFDRYITLSPQSLDTDFHHAVQVVNKSTLLMTGYFDGVSKGSGSIESSSTSDTTFRIGGTTSCNATVAFVRIYNRALSSTEVLQNYQSQFPRFLGENIVTSDLALYLDAAYRPSYPTTGTTWYDVSGYNNNATLVNGPTFNSGNGGSIVFDGTDDYGFTSSTTSVGNSNTVCAFIKLNGLQTNTSGAGLSGGTIYTPTANGVDNYIGISGNKLYLFATEIADVNNFGLIGTTSLDTSNSVWYYVTSVINGNTATIYINGVLEATITQPFIIASWSGNGYIGCRTPTTRLLKGSIANISVYSRALTQSEILQNFNAQKSRFGL